MIKKYFDLYGIFLVVIIISISCSKNQKSLKEMQDYSGPLTELTNVTNFFSDSGIVKVKLSAPKQLELKNGTQEFPIGIKVEFYDRNSTVTSVLTANSGVFIKSTGIFTATGNVIVKNLEKDEQLNTEVLHWNRKNKTVYTDKFVTIKTDDELLQGEGLKAAQDFSTYRIEKPTGSFTLEDEEEESEDDTL